jgi:hypothetical protein
LRPALSACLALVSAGCTSKAFVLVEVRDPNMVAKEASDLRIGGQPSDPSGQRIGLGSRSFPLSLSLSAASGSNGTVWIEALKDVGSEVLGRASLDLSFELTRLGAAFADLARPCAQDSECDDHQFCNGVESCVHSVCVSGPLPCPASGFSCVTSGCNEAARRCEPNVDHAACPNGGFCSPLAGCVADLPCQTHADCQDSSHCDGIESCVSGMCSHLPPVPTSSTVMFGTPTAQQVVLGADGFGRAVAMWQEWDPRPFTLEIERYDGARWTPASPTQMSQHQFDSQLAVSDSGLTIIVTIIWASPEAVTASTLDVGTGAVSAVSQLSKSLGGGFVSGMVVRAAGSFGIVAWAQTSGSSGPREVHASLITSGSANWGPDLTIAPASSNAGYDLVDAAINSKGYAVALLYRSDPNPSFLETSVYDPTNQLWSAPAPLSQDFSAAAAPALSFDDDAVATIVWPSSDFRTLWAIQGDGSSWSGRRPVIVTSGSTLTGDVRLAANRSCGQVFAIYGVEDSDLTRSIHEVEWSGTSWSGPRAVFPSTHDLFLTDLTMTAEGTPLVLLALGLSGDPVAIAIGPGRVGTTTIAFLPPGISGGGLSVRGSARRAFAAWYGEPTGSFASASGYLTTLGWY